MLRKLLALSVGLLGLGSLPAAAVPNSTALVVSVCGNQTYVADRDGPLTVDLTGKLCTSGSGGGGGGGTSSAYGDPFPTDGTAAGFIDSSTGDMVPATIDNASGGLNVTCVSGCSGGGGGGDVNIVSVGGNAVTTTIPVSGTVAATQSGSWVLSAGSAVIGHVITDSGSVAQVTNAGTFAVQAAQSGTWNIGTLATITNPVAVTQSGSWNVGQTGGPWTINLTQVAGASVATGHGVASGALRVELPTDGTGIVGLAAGSNTIGAVTQASGPWTINQTQIGGVSVSVGSGTNGTGVQRVTLATDQGALAAWGLGATGSAVPSGGQYQAANIDGNLTGLIACGSVAKYDASTSGSTQLVALTSSQTIRVCGYTILAAGTVNVKLVYGTGSNCATSPSDITPAFQLTAQAGLVDRAPYWQGLATAASNALCINASAAVAVQALVYYTKF